MNQKQAITTYTQANVTITRYENNTWDVYDSNTRKTTPAKNYEDARVIAAGQINSSPTDEDDLQLIHDAPLTALETELSNTDRALLKITLDQLAELELDEDEEQRHYTRTTERREKMKNELLHHWAARSNQVLNKRAKVAYGDKAERVILHKRTHITDAVTVARFAEHTIKTYLTRNGDTEITVEHRIRSCVSQWLTAAHIIKITKQHDTDSPHCKYDDQLRV